MKSLAMFSKKLARLDSRCRACKKQYMDGYWRSYQAANRERCRAHNRKWYAKNRDHILRKNKTAESRAKAVRYTTAWVRRNRDAYNSKRRELVRRMPKWANAFFISEAYDLAQRRTAATGITWHVDHIVPLRSPVVCGLHVEHNLRVVPASVNHRKSNKLLTESHDLRRVSFLA